MAGLTAKSAYFDGVFVTQGRDGLMIVNVYQEHDTFDSPSAIYTRGQDDGVWSYYIRTKGARSKNVEWAATYDIMPDDPLHTVLNLLASQAWLLHSALTNPEEFINGRYPEHDHRAVAGRTDTTIGPGDSGVPDRATAAALPAG